MKGQALLYNHRDDERALNETVKERAKSMRAGQHRKYAPIG